MNEYEFDFADDDPNGVDSHQPPPNAGPKWFRDYMDKAGQEMKSLREELQAARAKEAKAGLADKFKAEGIDPGAVNLYSGEPDEVDDWLKANKGFLAKVSSPADGGGDETEQPAGPPASAVPPESQAQMQRMTEAGTSGVAAPQGSEAELVAALQAASNPEEFGKIMRAHGNQHDWGT